MQIPADEWGLPNFALVHLVSRFGETPLSTPSDGPMKDVPFPEAVNTITARARNQNGMFRWRYSRAADGGLAKVLIGPDERPIRFWYRPAELGDMESKASINLTCLVIGAKGIIGMVVDQALRPLYSDEPGDANPSEANEAPKEQITPQAER